MKPSRSGVKSCILPLALLIFAGCFPVELDVSADGKILIPREEGFFSLDPASKKVELVYKSDGGKPI